MLPVMKLKISSTRASWKDNKTKNGSSIEYFVAYSGETMMWNMSISMQDFRLGYTVGLHNYQ
jgi:hypothetical protein